MADIKRVHQVLDGATEGNAIYNHARFLRSGLRQWGFAANLYAAEIDKSVADTVLPFRRYHPGRSEVLIYHYSTGSRLAAALQAMDVPLILIYHNVTPPEYLRGVGGRLSAQARRGRDELGRLQQRVAVAVTVSEYNRRELTAAGYERTKILPLAVSDELVNTDADATVLTQFDDDWVNILFVGRLAPNKCQEDIIKTLYYYRQINSCTRLFLVGGWHNTQRYAEWLRQFAGRLGLANVVFFPGQVSTAALAAYYRLADLFLCMSEHEGFGLPLVESMRFRVPVIAYASSAISETMGGAGILIQQKRFAVVAELIHLLQTDGELRERIVARQLERARNFEAQRVVAKFKEVLQEVLASLV